VIFVDTSALFAVLDRDDWAHEPARDAWTRMLSSDEGPLLVTSNYVLVETFALTQARLGMEAARLFHDSVLPVLRVHWITREEHESATQALLITGRRRLSLVDCSSFHLMRRLGIDRVFAFDRHFAEQGFEAVPTCPT